MRAIEIEIKLIWISPIISRTLHVNERSTFFDLHWNIQDIFWFEWYHLFEFTYWNNNRLVWVNDDDSMYNDEFWASKKAHKIKIIDFFEKDNINKLDYTYDFWDDRDFKIKIKKIVEISDKSKLPFVSKYSWLMLFEDIWWIYWLSDYISMYNKWDEFPDEEYWELEDFREDMEEHYNLEEIFSDFQFSNPKIILKNLDS